MTTKVERTGKDALLESARHLFLEHGYAAVSMQHIAEAAGMTKGAPYYHFKNKEDLFLHVFLNEITRQKEGFINALNQPGSVEERLIRAMAYAFRSTRTDVFTLYADAGRHIGQECIAHHELVKHKGDDLDSILIPFFREVVASGRALRIPPDRASHLFVLLMMGQLHTLHSDHKLAPQTGTPEEMAAELVDALLHGIF